ncbi:MAG: TatD family hydrolase [Firmicutes bacterium]|nr:TatD family hydrolase [Bacillota bacterium]
MFIDIHAHINDSKLIDDVDNVIDRANKAGVKYIVNATCDVKSIKETLELVKKYENVYATLGIHPQAIFEYDDEIEELIYSNKNNQKVIGIGEIGLDYHDMETQIAYIKQDYPQYVNITEEEVKNKQKEVFIKQIELASKMNLPIVVHSRDATADTLEIIKSKINLLKNKGLIHCFSGSVEVAKEYFKMGFYISVGGSITFKNARCIPDVIRECGIDNVMLETDCPYLSPEPYRGKINEPKNVVLVSDKIAEILDINYRQVEEKTTENAFALFGRLK